MNAKEARETARKVNTNEVDSQYAAMKLLIKTYAEEGKYEMFFYDYIKPVVQKKLESEGFDIENLGSFRNETTIKVKW